MLHKLHFLHCLEQQHQLFQGLCQEKQFTKLGRIKAYLPKHVPFIFQVAVKKKKDYCKKNTADCKAIFYHASN